MKYEPLIYYDEPDHKVVDLRPEGVPFVPLASRAVRRCTRSGPAAHVHRGLTEIVYCVRGRLAFDTPERSYPFLPGDVFVSGPNQVHAMREETKGLFVYRLLIDWPQSGRCLPGLTADETRFLVRSLRSPKERIFTVPQDVRNLFDRLFALYEAPKERGEERSFGLRLCVLGLLWEFAVAARKGHHRPVSKRIQVWIDRLAANPSQDYDIAAMAADAKLKPNVFIAEFKRAVGLPPHAYLIACRIDRAKKLAAANPKVTQAQLAIDLGFSSASHFVRAFKQVTGSTFSQWQKSISAKE